MKWCKMYLIWLDITNGVIVIISFAMLLLGSRKILTEQLDNDLDKHIIKFVSYLFCTDLTPDRTNVEENASLQIN